MDVYPTAAGGESSGNNCIYRLYREEGLGVRKRMGRKHPIGVRAPILVEAGLNGRWSFYFVRNPWPMRGGSAVNSL